MSTTPLGLILVVDDDGEIVDFLAEHLEEEGFAVVRAGSGAEALAGLCRGIPDVVLLDIAMPGMDGVEVLRRLRQDHPAIPVVMLTGNADEALARSTLQLGATDYVRKPFDMEHLNRVVWASLRPPVTPRETILLVEDDGDLRAVYQMALQISGYTVLAAADGPAALRVIEQHARPIDLLVTDLIMPGMSGLELAKRLRAADSATRVLYVSGHADVKTLEAHDPGAALLRKPLSCDNLRAKVQEILGEPSPAAGRRAG
jgi:CheY-like chemotaxis protein